MKEWDSSLKVICTLSSFLLNPFKNTDFSFLLKSTALGVGILTKESLIFSPNGLLLYASALVTPSYLSPLIFLKFALLLCCTFLWKWTAIELQRENNSVSLYSFICCIYMHGNRCICNNQCFWDKCMWQYVIERWNHCFLNNVWL